MTICKAAVACGLMSHPKQHCPKFTLQTYPGDGSRCNVQADNRIPSCNLDACQAHMPKEELSGGTLVNSTRWGVVFTLNVQLQLALTLGAMVISKGALLTAMVPHTHFVTLHVCCVFGCQPHGV